jgi:hypothetical protein
MITTYCVGFHDLLLTVLGFMTYFLTLFCSMSRGICFISDGFSTMDYLICFWTGNWTRKKQGYSTFHNATICSMVG